MKLRTIGLAVTVAASFAVGNVPAKSQQFKLPVWVSSRGAPASAKQVMATVTNRNTGEKETLGLWPFPLTGFEAEDFQFAPISPRPPGWASVDYLLPGSYSVVVTWQDRSGVSTTFAPEPLTVP